jgi:hypothetical protein
MAGDNRVRLYIDGQLFKEDDSTLNGSGFLNGDGPFHFSGHAETSISFSKSFGERFSLGITAQNTSDGRYLLDNSNTFGGTHWNYPRQISGELRYRFHY